MSLTALCINSYMNSFFPNKFSSLSKTHKCTSNIKYLLIKDVDVKIIDGIIISRNDLNIDNITSLSVIKNNEIIWDIPFKLLIKTGTIIEKSNNYYITLNHCMFYDDEEKFEFPLFKIIANMYVILNSKDDFDYDLVICDKFYDRKSKDIIEQKMNYPMTIFESLNVIPNQINKISPKLLASGLFIETNYPIKCYEMKIYDHMCQHFDDKLIDFYNCLVSKRHLWTKKHSMVLNYIFNKIFPKDIIDHIENYCNKKYEYLYWFPFDCENKYDDGYNFCSINFSRIDSNNTEIIVSHNNDEYYDINYNCRIYIKEHCVLVITHFGDIVIHK